VLGNGNWEFGLWLRDKWYPAKNGHFSRFKPDAPATLRFVAVRSHFEFYLDGTQVGSAENNTLESVEANQVIVLGGTYTKTFSQLVKFTNLSVVVP
jgi:hypothetical protein